MTLDRRLRSLERAAAVPTAATPCKLCGGTSASAGVVIYPPGEPPDGGSCLLCGRGLILLPDNGRERRTY